MNPEQVLVSKPEVIFLTGTESTQNPTAVLLGQGVNPALARARLQAFTERKGWANLPAVKEKRIYGIYQGASRTLLDYTMVQFMAKALYPSLFKEMDPLANYLDFYRRYLPVKADGTFAIAL